MLTGLKTYKKKTGDLFVPKSFTVPLDDARWPQELWGYRLGDGVGQLRLRLRKDLVSEPMTEELGSMDFAQNVAQFKWDRIVLPSLRQFHKVHGHTDVPRNFVVPKNETWPKLAWGRRLGLTVGQMRCTNHHAEQMAKSKAELEKLGFCYKVTERDWTVKILPSLKIHRQVFGHCIVRQEFKIPRCHPWPENAWGISLGNVVCKVRMKRSYAEQSARDKASLEAIDFAWDRDATVWNQHIIPSIQMFAKIFKHGKVPSNFVVPSEDPWPKAAWSLKLGVILCSLRSKGTYLKYFSRDAEMLDALGVPLKLSSRAWQLRIVPLIDIYANLYSDEGIPEDFVIPPEEPWPEEVWGVRLWLLVHRCAGATNEMPQN